MCPVSGYTVCEYLLRLLLPDVAAAALGCMSSYSCLLAATQIWLKKKKRSAQTHTLDDGASLIKTQDCDLVGN